MFLGDSSVGKTCLARLLIEGKVVQEQSNCTIGFDLHCKELLVDGIQLTVSKNYICMPLAKYTKTGLEIV